MTLKLVGTHPRIRNIRRTLRAMAHSRRDILIIGEPGVGKTFVGRLLHTLGPHCHLTLRALNFALTTERDQRFALFGSEPPDASAEREGYLEIPTTLLLRNIEHAKSHIQERLVDALSHREFRRTPDGPLREIPGRIIFTTSEQDFRQPEHSRLIEPLRRHLFSLVKFSIPPLRERVEDIPLLAAHYRKYSLSMSNPALSPDDLLLAPDFLKVYPWRDNIRELKACLHATLVHSHGDILCQKERLEFEKLMMLLDDDHDVDLRKSTALIEELILDHVLAVTDGHQRHAARKIGISPGALQHRRQRKTM